MGQKWISACKALTSLLTKEHLYGVAPYGKMQGEVNYLKWRAFELLFADEKKPVSKLTSKPKRPILRFAYVKNGKSF